MLNIYYGRENLDKEKFIFSKVKEQMIRNAAVADQQREGSATRAIESGQSTGKTVAAAADAFTDGVQADRNKLIFIMVPDQYTLEAEKQAFRHLGISSLMDVEIVSASSLGSNVLSELGGSKRNFIDKYGRHMLLFKSAKEQSDNLEIFRGMESRTSFLDSVNNFISEMKQYNCGSEDLKAMAESAKDTYTGKKLMDVYKIFADYEKQIEGKYTDSEDYIDLFLGKIQDSEQIKGSTVWVYGYDSFAPKTMALLGQLMAAAAEVNLVLTWDNKRSDRELFELTGMVMNNAEYVAESLGIASRRYTIPADFADGGKAAIIKHIEQELYTLPSRKSEGADGLTLVEAAGIYNEAESAASYVLHLVRDCGLAYKDIRLVCNDMENRRAVIERVFDEYGIEVFSDTKRDILSNPIVQYVTSLIDVVIEKYRTDSLFGMLKSGFGDLTAEELAELENYGIKYKIKGTMWKTPFKKGSVEYGESLAQIEAFRMRAIAPAVPLEDVFNEKKTGDFVRRFYEYISKDLDLAQKTLNFIAEQEEQELFDLADETAQVWDSLVGILNQIYEIMGDEPFDAAEFRDMLLTGLGQVEIGLLPPTEDGLILGNVQRSRSGRVKALVVMGANEGVLPQERPTQGLFSAEEREMFREDGKELCKVDSVRFMEEKLAIYRTLASADEYLWMSYSMSDGEGNEMKPSAVFLKMQEIFPNAEVQRDVLNQQSQIGLINNKVSGLRHLSKALQDVSEGKSLENCWAQSLSWFERNEPGKLDAVKSSVAFTGEQRALGEAAASALFKKDVNKAMLLSPSRLEKFSRCPFSHLVSYGLKPEERRIFEAAPREIGDIYHQCLMRITEELSVEGVAITGENSPWMTVSREQCESIVADEMAKISAEYREGLFTATKMDSYRADRVVEICNQACWTVVEQVRAGRILAIEPEVGFRRGGKLPPIEIEIDNQKVYIEGIIDRVDYLNDDRVKIIDYKTGNESFSVEEAEAGYRLQLMLYLTAACGQNGEAAAETGKSAEVSAGAGSGIEPGVDCGGEIYAGGNQPRKPAGVFYFKIKEPMIDFSQKEVDQETLANEIRKSFKLDGVMIDDPVVIGDIAGEFEGFSEVVPIRNTKEGIKNSGSEGLLTEEEFRHMQEAVMGKVTEACASLLKGEIDVHPMKTKDRSACTFCQYRGVCRFDTIFDGCKYNIIG